FINEKPPPLGALERAADGGAEGPAADAEHPVAEVSEGLAETDTLRSFSPGSELQWRLARQGNFVEVDGTDFRRAEPVPPRRHEAAPYGALAIGGLQHLVEITEEARDTGDLEDSADDGRPVLVAPDGQAPARAPRGEPRLTKREAG